MADIYTATRPPTLRAVVGAGQPRPERQHLDGAETRPSLSWDGTALYFGSTRPGGEGMADHYVTTREPIHG